MRNVLAQPPCLIAAVALLMAADPAWKSKPTAEWTEEDAKQVLAKSPWAKETRATITRRMTEDQLREAGRMGQRSGLGNEGVDPKSSGPMASLNSSVRSLPQPIALSLRWENALPVRIAELKAHEVEPPTAEDGYRIAVYGIPVPDSTLGGDTKQPMKNLAALKRIGKKDVKPVSVEMFQRDREMVVVYLFPLSAEISEKDGHVQFQAQIGRIIVDQSFDVGQMEFQGKLEL